MARAQPIRFLTEVLFQNPKVRCVKVIHQPETLEGHAADITVYYLLCIFRVSMDPFYVQREPLNLY